MRVRAVVPGAAAACAVALAGCGSGAGIRTVTVTAPSAASRPRPAPDPPATTTAARERSATTTRNARSTSAEPPPTRTVRVPTTVTTSAPRPTSTEPGAREVVTPGPDPVGGTSAAAGRVTGTGYTVQVPPGWNDGARRFEGSGVAFDLSYVKGRGTGVSSNILIVRTPDRLAKRRDAVELRDTLRRRVEAEVGGADVTIGPRLTVDGEVAVTFLTRRRIGPTKVLQRQVAVVRDGAVFSIGLNAVRETSAKDVRVFGTFLRSWRWR